MSILTLKCEFRAKQFSVMENPDVPCFNINNKEPYCSPSSCPLGLRIVSCRKAFSSNPITGTVKRMEIESLPNKRLLDPIRGKDPTNVKSFEEASLQDPQKEEK